MKKFLAITKGIINYIFAMIFAVIFALFLDANVGWFILIALIMAPILSVFFAWLSAENLSVSCEMEQVLLSKDDKCHMDIRITNLSIFPSPPVELTMTQEPGLPCKDKKILVSIMSRATQYFPVTFTAKIAGPFDAGIETIRVTDYLGLFSFPVKKLNQQNLTHTIPIIPNIAEISARDDQLVQAMQMSLRMDDGDDTVEAPAFAFGGFPGYDSREYIPGDPLKRINWKQSAKKDKLLVRLDDEMAAQSISVVLDSVFHKQAVDITECATYSRYHDCAKNEILPRIAEDAVENALGMMHVLVRHSYTIHFYARMGQDFTQYEIQDEADLESLRLELSKYSFSDEEIPRFPAEIFTAKGGCVSLFSTPNSSADAHGALQSAADLMHTTIYSAIEEAKKQKASFTSLSMEKPKITRTVDRTFLQKAVDIIAPLIIPYFLALLISTSLFEAFDVSFFSPWTILQAITCVLIFALCEFVRRHRIIGGMLITIVGVCLFVLCARIVFANSYGLSYMYWFLSGGDSVETIPAYLITLVLGFTSFFATVVYYFTRNLYRTSFLMLISLMPLIIHVKVMQDINMVPVVLITALNVAAFLVHQRMTRDKDKRQVGHLSGLVSVGLYTLIFVLIGLAVPKEEETRYYYIFEELFLGGNVSTSLPEEFSNMSEFSGNSDGFNGLNDRKLYEIDSVDFGPLIYLRRQTFDLYDFEKDRWYAIKDYSTPSLDIEHWKQNQSKLNLSQLTKILYSAEELQPGFMEKYGLSAIPDNFSHPQDTIHITTTNFPSVAYIAPSTTTEITPYMAGATLPSTAVSPHGVFQTVDGFLASEQTYDLNYYEQYATGNKWTSMGGSDMSLEESIEMFEELEALFSQTDSASLSDVEISEADVPNYSATISAYLTDAQNALAYRQACEENNALIPEKVRNLAQEITKDCTYDWEKAKALQNYFEDNHFIYDLSYKAPDDSVEYFLFIGKTGTCSDYASAYVLMARSLGLTVRYSEGFVPDMEYGGKYVVRTSHGHAYPEVFIENVGYVIFEATKPAVVRQSGDGYDSGFLTFVLTMGVRILLIMTIVSCVIMLLLFLHRVAAPYLRETYFKHQLKKATPSQAIAMIYKRLLDRHTYIEIKNARALTPFEYGCRFEAVFGQDLSEMIFLLESLVYTAKTSDSADLDHMYELYRSACRTIAEVRKEKKREKRKRKRSIKSSK